MAGGLLFALLLSLTFCAILTKNHGKSKTNLESTKADDNPFADPCSFARIEGDIAVEGSEKADRGKGRRTERAAVADKTRLWPNGVIPYSLSPEYSWREQGLIQAAMNHWESNTCLTFVPQTDEFTYVDFAKGSCSCCSFVGKKHGKQGISLPSRCLVFGVIVHEIGHAIGYWHEHTRPDRDRYIEVVWGNIESKVKHNFYKQLGRIVNSLGEPYDYGSIMHYGKYTFSNSSGKKTLRTKVKDVSIGQRIALSKGDIKQTNKLYSCAKCGSILTASRGTFSSPSYPKKYPLNSLCVWTIIAPKGVEIQLRVSPFHLERRHSQTKKCSFDYLEVRERNGGALLGKFCGKDSIPVIKSSGRLYIKMVSNSRYTNRGFRAHYQTVCGGRFFGSQGTITSPNFPSLYPKSMNCSWHLSGKTNISIQFDFLDIEGHSKCRYDYLEFHSESFSFKRKECGSKFTNFVAPGNSLVVTFISDSSLEKNGFRFRWTSNVDECLDKNGGCEQLCVNTVSGFYCSCNVGFSLLTDKKSCIKDCGGVLRNLSGTIQSPGYPRGYPSNKRCEWRLVFLPSYTVVLTFSVFQLEASRSCQFDKLIIKDVYQRHFQFCGWLRFDPMKLGYIVNITFVSDRSASARGFSISYRADENECQDDRNNDCSQECVNTNDGYKCACHAGYLLGNDGYTCRDIDECESTSVCNHLCINTNGNYTCQCRQGYEIEADRKSCSDIDECHVNKGGCSHTCINEEGSYRCLCAEGFFLQADRKSCKDYKCGGRLETRKGVIKSPRYPNNYPSSEDCTWHVNAPSDVHFVFKIESMDLEHSIGCDDYDYIVVRGGGLKEAKRICKIDSFPEIIKLKGGFSVFFHSDPYVTKTGFHAIYYEDDSVDWCQHDNGGCAHVCSLDGSRVSCHCQPGYVLVNRTECADIDECLTSSCSQHCVNSPGSFSCECFTGFETSLSDPTKCHDVNECALHSVCDHSCINRPGTFDCSCRAGYTLASDGRTCQDGCQNCSQVCFENVCSCHSKDFFLLPGGNECQKCVKVFTTSSGNLSVPPGALSTEKGVTCAWKLVAKPGHRWRISFEETNCHQQTRLSLKTPTALIVDSCMEISASKMFLSPSNILRVEMIGPAKILFGNVKAKFEAVCGGSVIATDKNQNLYSHNGKSSYPSNSTCLWEIVNTRKLLYQLKVHFGVFSLTDSSNFTSDYLEITGSMTERYYGTQLQKKTLTFTSPKVVLKLQSAANSKGDKGFELVYQRVKKTV
eukprot:m.178711 g.178711  ORF g.178711 m.178711 type:complete len:1251 (+) comp39187_c0_seq2:367-4119(+)